MKYSGHIRLINDKVKLYNIDREANDSLRNTCYSLQNRIEELETELYNYQASGD